MQDGREEISDGHSTVYPPSAALGHWTFVVAQRLFRREEPPAVFTGELADLTMLCDLVPQTVMLSRETLLAPKSAGKGGAGFGLVRFHVHLQRVLTSESPLTADDGTWEPPPRLLGVGLGP